MDIFDGYCQRNLPPNDITDVIWYSPYLKKVYIYNKFRTIYLYLYCVDNMTKLISYVLSQYGKFLKVSNSKHLDIEHAVK